MSFKTLLKYCYSVVLRMADSCPRGQNMTWKAWQTVCTYWQTYSRTEYKGSKFTYSPYTYIQQLSQTMSYDNTHTGGDIHAIINMQTIEQQMLYIYYRRLRKYSLKWYLAKNVFWGYLFSACFMLTQFQLVILNNLVQDWDRNVLEKNSNCNISYCICDMASHYAARVSFHISRIESHFYIPFSKNRSRFVHVQLGRRQVLKCDQAMTSTRMFDQHSCRQGDD